MASISFPVTGLQPIPHDQPSSAPATSGGPQAVDPNQQDAPQGDTVTISATFPPPQATQQPATIRLEQFSVFLTQSQTQPGQTSQATATPASANIPGSPQATASTAQGTTQAAPATAAGVPATIDPASAAANDSATQSGASSTPQQELTQLDQTLQQLGINPQSISLFNRLSLLLYANDPAALEQLIQAQQGVEQQLSQIAGGANGATQTPGLAQGSLPPALQTQAQPQASQDSAQITPEPLAPLQATPQAQAPAPPPAQLEAQNQNPPADSTATAVTLQLSFSDIQATFGQQAAPAQTSSQDQSSSNGASSAPSAQTNNLLANFQELQLSFQEAELQSPQQQTSGAANSSNQAQNQGVNIIA
jgi:hypothetical protein